MIAVILNAKHLFYPLLKIIDPRDKFMMYRQQSLQKFSHDFSGDKRLVGVLAHL